MFDTTHLHPMMVHFPIALLVLGFFAELLGIACKKQVYMPKISLSSDNRNIRSYCCSYNW